MTRALREAPHGQSVAALEPIARLEADDVHLAISPTGIKVAAFIEVDLAMGRTEKGRRSLSGVGVRL